MKRRKVKLHVSDHAVLRWLEREHGFDVEAARRHLTGLAMNGAELGAVAVQIGRVKLVLRENGETPDGVGIASVPTVLARGGMIDV